MSHATETCVSGWSSRLQVADERRSHGEDLETQPLVDRDHPGVGLGVDRVDAHDVRASSMRAALALRASRGAAHRCTNGGGGRSHGEALYHVASPSRRLSMTSLK